MGKTARKAAQAAPRQPRTVVVEMIVTEAAEEGQEPKIIHRVTVDGRPVEVALAVVATGEIPLMLRSGGEGWLGSRLLAQGLRAFGDKLYDQVLHSMGSVLDLVHVDLQMRQYAAQEAQKQADQGAETPPEGENPPKTS